MFKLNYTPFIGSTINLQLSFRDNYGNYYVPAVVNYTYLALNSDKNTWSVVSELQDVTVPPSSVVGINIPSSKNIGMPSDTLVRKIIVHWQAFLYGSLQQFTDTVSFNVSPLPVITNQKESTIIEPQPGSYSVTKGLIKFSSPIKSFKFTLNGIETETIPDSTLTSFTFEINEPGTYTWEITEIESLLPEFNYEDGSGELVEEGSTMTTDRILLTNPEEQSMNNAETLSQALSGIKLVLDEINQRLNQQ